MIKICFVLYFLIFSFETFSLNIKVRFAATQWCPYTCKDMANQGIVSNLIRKRLEKNNIGMTIDFLPWKRAIKSVQTGENDALLTVVLEEAPSLSFTTVPTMSYRVCLFSGNSKIEEIKNITQLSKKRIGIASQYGYGAPFDKYILENKNNKDRILTLFGGNLVSRFILLTQKKRISYFLEDENVVNFYRKKIKSTFCTKKNPFFIGFSPLYINKEKLIKILDDEALREDFSRN